MSKESKRNLYRVKFQGKGDKSPVEVVVAKAYSSEFLGLISLEGFVFGDTTKRVILPAEDDARKRFHTVDRLHVPYHNIIYIEEFQEAGPNLQELPFMRGLENPSIADPSDSERPS